MDRIDGLSDLPTGIREVQGPGRYRLERRADDRLFDWAHGPDSAKQILFPAREHLATAIKANGDLRIEAAPQDERRFAFIGLRSCDLHAIADPGPRVPRRPRARSPLREAPARVVLRRRELLDPRRNVFLRVDGHGPEVHGRVRHRADGARGGVPRGGWNRPRPRGSDRDRRRAPRPTTNRSRRSGSGATPSTRWVASWTRRTCRPCCTATASTPAGKSSPTGAWRAGTARPRARRASATTSSTPRTSPGRPRRARASGRRASRSSSATPRGGDVRSSREARYRQWLTHKFASWIDQFGTSGCVGCGRCITWCPVGIDVTEEIAAIRETDGDRKAEQEEVPA